MNTNPNICLQYTVDLIIHSNRQEKHWNNAKYQIIDYLLVCKDPIHRNI